MRPPHKFTGATGFSDYRSVPLSLCDGKLTLAGKTVSERDLIHAIKLLKEKAESAGRTLLLTLEADEKTQYKKIEEVIDAAAKAGVTNLTFQAPSSNE